MSGPSVISLFQEHDPYTNLSLRPKLLDGWSATPNYTYAKMVAKAKATVVVEVGVWRGLSAAHIALAMKARGHGGVLFAVDTWLGSIEFWNRRFTAGRPDPGLAPHRPQLSPIAVPHRIGRGPGNQKGEVQRISGKLRRIPKCAVFVELETSIADELC